jgi:hypothetical protein
MLILVSAFTIVGSLVRGQIRRGEKWTSPDITESGLDRLIMRPAGQASSRYARPWRPDNSSYCAAARSGAQRSLSLAHLAMV